MFPSRAIDLHPWCLQHLLALPPGGFDVLDALPRPLHRRLAFRCVLILAHKRIRIPALLQIPQRMVHLAMLGLVGAHVEHQIAQRAFPLRHVPVLDGDLGRGGGFEHGEGAGVDGGDAARVGQHGFFLEVADEAVAGARRDEVGGDEGVEEDALRAEEHQAHEDARFGQREEGEEVHALVVGFFEEGFDPVRRNTVSIVAAWSGR